MASKLAGFVPVAKTTVGTTGFATTPRPELTLHNTPWSTMQLPPCQMAHTARPGPVTANIGWYIVSILHDWPSCNIDITWPVESRLWVDRMASFFGGFLSSLERGHASPATLMQGDVK